MDEGTGKQRQKNSEPGYKNTWSASTCPPRGGGFGDGKELRGKVWGAPGWFS